MDEAVTFAHNGVMVNAGQCCIAGSRTFVHEKIYDEFVARSRDMAEKRNLLTGDPFNPDTKQGPQVREVERGGSDQQVRESSKVNRRLHSSLGERDTQPSVLDSTLTYRLD